MSDTLQQNRNQSAAGRNQPSDNNPIRDSSRLESQGQRPVGDVFVRRNDSDRAPGVPGNHGGTAVDPKTDRPDLGSTPLGQMHRLIERAGEVPFPDDIIRILSEPIDDTLVDIRPDGLIFVSHPHYRDRLDAAFGVGAWALVPLDKPQIKDNRVVYWGFLKARGQYIGDAVGGSQYYPNNAQGSYDNSVEAAKSDCLVRCCKALPMFRECWDREYADYWKATYAEQGVTAQSRGQKVWKKKGIAMRDFTTRPDRQSQGEMHRATRVTDEQKAHIEAIANEGTLRIAARDEHNENEPDHDIAEAEYAAWEQEGD